MCGLTRFSILLSSVPVPCQWRTETDICFPQSSIKVSSFQLTKKDSIDIIFSKATTPTRHPLLMIPLKACRRSFWHLSQSSLNDSSLVVIQLSWHSFAWQEEGPRWGRGASSHKPPIAAEWTKVFEEVNLIILANWEARVECGLGKTLPNA